MFLEKELFSSIVHYTPLVSIDLIIENSDGEVLLGKRVNEPAKGYWFVPGGRVFKDESLDTAFSRTVREEIGLELERKNAMFMGVYEHFYKNNVFDDNFSTHYIVLGHKIVTDEKLSLNNQHDKYEWFAKEFVLNNECVHKYAKDYFKPFYKG